MCNKKSGCKFIEKVGCKMSNFICSECGMTNIDCGGSGYKTPKEIELEKENKRLQEQIKEANEVIKKYSQFNNWEGDDKDQHDMTHFIGEDNGCGWEIAQDYLEKWGVK